MGFGGGEPEETKGSTVPQLGSGCPELFPMVGNMPPPEVAPVGKCWPHNAPTVKGSVTAKFTHAGDLRLHDISPGAEISVPREGIPAPRKLSNRPTNYKNYCALVF